MIPEEKIDEIRQSARISEFISPHVELKNKGRSLMGLCPFHSEKTPSFSVNDEGGFFHCFGCSAGGNVFKFLMEVENLSFPESVRKVAGRYGIDVPEVGGHATSEREALFAANASALRFFKRYLHESDKARPVLDYLAGRGVGAEAIEAFALGAAPATGDSLVQWFSREGVDLSVGLGLGLIGEKDGRYYDRLRARLMFPIRDIQDRVIGFAGRAAEGANGPKYLNSPESPVYQKSRALYGLAEAREQLRGSSRLLVVEGYLDVIALYEAGLGSALATCGTAMTAEQARLLKRFGSEVVVVFDGDEAGKTAAARSFPVLVTAGLWPKAVFLPDGEDPDSFVRAKGGQALAELAETAGPLADAYLEQLGRGRGTEVDGVARTGAELGKLIAKVADPFERDLLVRKASLWTGLSESVLRRTQTSSGTRSAAGRPPGGAPGPEEMLVSAMLAGESARRVAIESPVHGLLEGSDWQAVVVDIMEAQKSGHAIDVSETLASLPEQFRDRVAARLGDGSLKDNDICRSVAGDCIKNLERRARRSHNLALAEELRKMEQISTVEDPGQHLSDWRPRSGSDA